MTNKPGNAPLRVFLRQTITPAVSRLFIQLQKTPRTSGTAALRQLRTNRRNGSGRGSFDSALRRPGSAVASRGPAAAMTRGLAWAVTQLMPCAFPYRRTGDPPGTPAESDVAMFS